MIKILKLTYNELFKQLKKTSMKIIVAIIVLTAMLAPIVLSKVEENTYNQSVQDHITFQLASYQEDYEQYKNDKTEKGGILRSIAEAEMQYYKLQQEAGIGYDDWRNEAVQEYKLQLYKVLALEKVSEGISEEVLLGTLNNIDPQEVAMYYNLEKETLQKKFKEEKEVAKEKRNLVLESDYKTYLKSYIQTIEEYLNVNEEKVEKLEKQLQKDTENQSLQNFISDIRNKMKTDEEAIRIAQYRLENSVDFEKDNWRHCTLEGIDNALKIVNREMLSKDEYLRTASMMNMQMTYEDYKVHYAKQQEKAKEAVEIGWYSLEHDMPQLEYVQDARSTVDGLYHYYVVIAILVSIIVAGGIVASEFSKGTIRLLMIRPVSRTKILVSKFLAVCVLGYGVILASIIALTLGGGMAYGFDTLNIPVVQMVEGSITKIQYFSYLMPQLLLTTTSLLFIVTVVFMLSTLTKNIAMTVASGMVLALGSLPVTLAFVSTGITIVADTFIPYINQSLLELTPMIEEMLVNQYGKNLNPILGSIQLIGVAAILLGITIIMFNKKDIKN